MSNNLYRLVLSAVSEARQPSLLIPAGKTRGLDSHLLQLQMPLLPQPNCQRTTKANNTRLENKASPVGFAAG